MRAVAPEPAEDVPAVGDERAQNRRDGRALHVLRDEAAPAPLVLHLVEDVLAVAALAVKLRRRARIVVEVCDERVPFVALRVHVVVGGDKFKPGEDCFKPAVGRVLPSARLLLDWTPHQEDTPLPAPAAEQKARVYALPSIPCVLPGRRVPEIQVEQVLHEPCAPDLEEVGDAVRLAAGDYGLVPESDVAPGELRPQAPGKPLEEPVEHVRRVDARRLVARVDDNAEDKPQLRDAKRVVAVRRPARFLRVVAELRAFLVPVERLHRRVQAEDVVLVEQGGEEPQVRNSKYTKNDALLHACNAVFTKMVIAMKT